MIETVPLTSTVVRVLHAFADGTFEMQTMSRVAATLGVPSWISEVRLACFDLPGNAVLQLAADEQGERVGAAIVSLCGWDAGVTAVLTTHAERAAYDAHYDQALDTITSTIGGPDHDGADEGLFPFRWSVWLGKTGLMALQQSHYDYCPDINIWVRPRTERAFAPTQPFVDWLMSEP